MCYSLEQSLNSSDNLTTYFDLVMQNLDESLKYGYPNIKNNFASLITWMSFLCINVYFIIIGLTRAGNNISLIGLYGLYEIVWELCLVDPHWARRKVIIIEYLVRRYYNSHDFVVEH